MDLIYKIGGENQHRTRLITETLGSSVVAALEDNSKAAFSIWCDNTVPPSQYHVWWQSTSLESVDKITSYAKTQIGLYPNINIVILEHSVQSLDNITFFILVSKDNIVRTFQSEKDVCLYLKDIVSRYN